MIVEPSRYPNSDHRHAAIAGSGRCKCDHVRSGFLLKDSPPDSLIAGIFTVARGDALLAPSVTRRLIAEFVTRPPLASPPQLRDLSPRETQVLIHLAHGESNREIAARMFVSETTVKTHVSSILAKLGCRDRVQAVVLAYEAGLAPPGMP